MIAIFLTVLPVFSITVFCNQKSNSPFLYLPKSRNNSIAEFAFITDYVVGRNVITLALNQQFFTVVAICIIPFMARHIPEIDIADSFMHG